MEGRKNKRILLAAPYSVVEPLGLFYLTTISKQEGWGTRVFLYTDNQDEFLSELKDFNPSIVGFTAYTGGHRDAFDLADLVMKYNPETVVVIGGPHATCFPYECLSHSDFVVVGEGLHSLREILNDKAQDGVLYCQKREEFPISDRQEFYTRYPEHYKSPIKSVIANFGCPFACSYCYNSMDKKLFPLLFRKVENVIQEVDNVMSIAPDTKILFFQDDVFGIKVPWLEMFAKEYSKFGVPFHCQTRFEFVDPAKESGIRRLDLLKESGCSGLTLAIESSNPIIRKEILGRNMESSLIFRTFNKMASMGFKARTEQMLGLPYGATSESTPMNLDADLETLEMNVKLRQETGLPTIAWASVLMPYKGTRIWNYCNQHGFYTGDNDDLPKKFFERSVLKFARKWTGPELNRDSDVWMKVDELENYRDKMFRLQKLFHLLALIPDGHKLAREVLEGSTEEVGNELGNKTKYHLYAELYGTG